MLTVPSRSSVILPNNLDIQIHVYLAVVNLLSLNGIKVHPKLNVLPLICGAFYLTVFSCIIFPGRKHVKCIFGEYHKQRTE